MGANEDWGHNPLPRGPVLPCIPGTVNLKHPGWPHLISRTIFEGCPESPAWRRDRP